MAYTSCAASLGGNIAVDCSNPPKAGFTGEGLLIDLDQYTPTYVQDGSNPRILTSITLGSGEKVCVVDNVWSNPFDGASRTLSTENGRPKYNLSLPVRVPLRSADGAKNVIEPLAQSRLLGIFKMNDGRYLVYGFSGTMRATEQTQGEGENAGDWLVTLTSEENWAVCELKGADDATTKAVYDALKAAAY